ncbi:MAG: DUF2029 domain-containing protein [Blastocatellia bacterium]|nr:DUF2029 domain-containing protein [Blastocatellia bacterium]
MPASNMKKPQLFFLVFNWFLISGGFFLLAGAGLPVYQGDATTFMPAIINVAAGRGLTNTFVTYHLFFDPSGKGAFNAHGFLYQIVVGHLMAGGTALDLYRWNALLNTVTLGLMLWTLIRLATCWAEPKPVRWPTVAVCGAMLWSFSTYLAGLAGRPEPFSLLLLAGFCLTWTLLPERWRWLAIGGFFPLLALTNPAPAALAGVCFLTYRCGNQTFRAVVFELGKAFALGGAIFGVGFLSLYPYGFSEWLHLVFYKGMLVYGGPPIPSLHDLVTYFVTFGATPLFLLPAGLAGGAMAFWIRENRSGIQTKAGFLTGTILALGLTWQLCLSRPSQLYYLMALLPLGYCAVLWGWLRFEALVMNETMCFKLGLVTVVSVLAISALGFGRYLALYQVHRTAGGVPLSVARSRMADLLAENTGPVGVTGGLWATTENLPTLYQIRKPFGLAPYVRGGGRYLVLQQDGYKVLKPPKIEGFDLIYSDFSPVKPVLWGIPLAQTVPGYQMAVYRVQTGTVTFPLRFNPAQESERWTNEEQKD